MVGLCLLGEPSASYTSHFSSCPRGMKVVGLCSSNEKTLPRFNFEGLPLTSASCSPYVMYSSSPLPFTWLKLEGLDHWGMKEHT